MDYQSNLVMDEDTRFVRGELKVEEMASNTINNNRRSKNSPASDARNKLPLFDSEDYLKWDEDLMSCSIPPDMEEHFAVAVFELGLKHCTPKILMDMLLPLPTLTRSHLKSHLQKARVQSTRFTEDFRAIWLGVLQNEFSAFQHKQRWCHAKPALHKAYRKQLAATREFEKYKKLLVQLAKFNTAAQDVMNNMSLNEGKMVMEICSTIVKAQGNCDGLSGIVNVNRPSDGTL